MSRIALVFCLLVTVVGTGCNSDSTFTEKPATSEVRSPELNDDMARQVDPALDDAQVKPAGADESNQATTPVTTSVRGNGNGRPGDAQTVDISFDDIDLPMQEDMVFRPFMLTDRAKELDGKRVRISGYMLPDSKTKGIKQFVLLKNTECKFGPGGQADHLVNVLIIEGDGAKFRDDPVSVEGTLIVKPFTGPDGNTWSIYDLACDNVTRYRPRR